MGPAAAVTREMPERDRALLEAFTAELSAGEAPTELPEGLRERYRLEIEGGIVTLLPANASEDSVPLTLGWDYVNGEYVNPRWAVSEPGTTVPQFDMFMLAILLTLGVLCVFAVAFGRKLANRIRGRRAEN
jgi:hypothetical protein